MERSNSKSRKIERESVDKTFLCTQCNSFLGDCKGKGNTKEKESSIEKKKYTLGAEFRHGFRVFGRGYQQNMIFFKIKARLCLIFNRKYFFLWSNFLTTSYFRNITDQIISNWNIKHQTGFYIPVSFRIRGFVFGFVILDFFLGHGFT
ncbi:hypothetical protein RCL_jg2666.t2 [Rhizophagus clarus]|uniref:Uncharacterized protein n=1 Tax=Rhizophagus clarus TaxID=94130 RepID=A0A8H3R1B6_9GLOM|nr:hypothetical protein RCL_jg2666.t2 [Rhizophagus clarus]